MPKKVYASWGTDKTYKWLWRAALQDAIFAFKSRLDKDKNNKHSHYRYDQNNEGGSEDNRAVQPFDLTETMMKSNITTNVEFLAGTELRTAVSEAKEKAGLWKVAYVTFDFNGVDFSIGANANVEEVIAEWERTHGKPYGICAA